MAWRRCSRCQACKASGLCRCSVSEPQTRGVSLLVDLCLMCMYSVGDGTFLFSQMESTFWIAKRYDIPILLIVLNNGGWNAPKVSALLVHKNGFTSQQNRKGELLLYLRLRVLHACHERSLTEKLSGSRCQYLLRTFSKLRRNSRCRREYLGWYSQRDQPGR